MADEGIHPSDSAPAAEPKPADPTKPQPEVPSEPVAPQTVEASQAAAQPLDAPAPAEEVPQQVPPAADEKPRRTAAPVHVDNLSRRNDDDALNGHFVEVVDGEHKGRWGAFVQALEHDKSAGYPTKILVRTRDEFNELLTVLYKHVRPTDRKGR